MNDFKSRLKELRLSRGLSQSDLAKRCGFQPSAISHFETGEREPSMNSLDRLASALRCSIDSLLGKSVEANGQEARILRQFRAMNPERQKLLLRIIDSFEKE